MADASLGTLGGSGTFYDTLGPGDPIDTFSFSVTSDVTITWSSFLPQFPESPPNTYSQSYSAGQHEISWNDPGYTETLNYGFRYTIVYHDADEQELADLIDNSHIEAAGWLLNFNAEKADFIAALTGPESAASKYIEGFGNKLGLVGNVLDASLRVEAVALEYVKPDGDPEREAFAQTFDKAVAWAAAYNGAVVGGAVGSAFFGVGSAAGAALGAFFGLAGGYVYSEVLSDKMQEAARNLYDSVGSNEELQFNAISAIPSMILLDDDIDIIPFDADWYLATYADAYDEVASGELPSAYVHFVTKGVSLGYFPNPDMPTVLASDLGYGDPQTLVGLKARGNLLNFDLGEFAGDELSASENEIAEAINAQRSSNTLAAADASFELTAIANRFAWELAHNFADDPLTLKVFDTGFGETWSDGDSFADGLAEFTADVSVSHIVMVSNGRSAAEVVGDVLFDPSVLDANVDALGIAEYHGIWVVVFGESSGTIDVAADSGGHSSLDRIGQEIGETIALGTWGGSIAGRGGNDQLFGNVDGDNVLLDGGEGNDVIRAYAGDDTLIGADGADTLVGGSGGDSQSGGVGADNIDGQAGDDTLLGGDGQDLVVGGGGADLLSGEGGGDSLFGGEDNDTVSGGAGDDTINGGTGDDTIGGDAGRDSLLGANGDDTLHGFGSHDSLYGGNGDDDLRGGFGKDLLGGSGNNDVLRGFEGDDRLFGGGGNDTLLGNDDNDVLTGGGGTDRLKGDAGNDTLVGSFGADSVTGGAGDDEFYFRKTHGADTFDDFVAGAGTDDHIRLIAFGAAFDTFGEVIAAASDNGTHTTIDFGGGDTITLLNVVVGDLHADDFIFG